MKKGSRALHCHKCNKVVGWEVPTGKFAHGFPIVTINMKTDGCIIDKLGSRYYFCTTCNEMKGEK